MRFSGNSTPRERPGPFLPGIPKPEGACPGPLRYLPGVLYHPVARSGLPSRPEPESRLDLALRTGLEGRRKSSHPPIQRRRSGVEGGPGRRAGEGLPQRRSLR
jgi:hypothetical protein